MRPMLAEIFEQRVGHTNKEPGARLVFIHVRAVVLIMNREEGSKIPCERYLRLIS